MQAFETGYEKALSRPLCWKFAERKAIHDGQLDDSSLASYLDNTTHYKPQ